MILATAGHIDHGKTALVRALTGVDTDRLPEEKKRGLTIDLGFAYASLPDGSELGFVDVPGHERFLPNMLAGVLSIDRVLLVVAADDGPRPQTIEHLDILELIEVAEIAGVVTKIDRAGPDRTAAVGAEVSELLAGAGYSNAPIFAVSSHTGAGIAAVTRYLEASAARVRQFRAAMPPRGLFRLGIDRAFTLPGIGLVVTGTVTAGTVSVGDRLILSPRGIPVRVRGLHARNRAIDSAAAGERCAVNISGSFPDGGEPRRGDWLVASERHLPVRRIDLLLRAARHSEATLRDGSPVHLHLGTQDVVGRAAMLSRRTLTPTETGWVQIDLDQPIAALHGDRAVLRDHAARTTLGGGRVVDPLAPRRRRRAPERLAMLEAMAPSDPVAALERMLAAAGVVDLTQFALVRNLTSAELEGLTGGATAGWLRVGPERAAIAVTGDYLTALADRIAALLAGWHRTQPDMLGPTRGALVTQLKSAAPEAAVDAALRELAGAGRAIGESGMWRLPEHRPRLTPGEEKQWGQLRLLLAEGGLRPPRVREIAAVLALEPKAAERFLHRAERLGRVVKVADNRFFLPETIAQLAAVARDLAAAAPERVFTAAMFNERSGVGRNLSIQILEYLDRIGATRRTGDVRVALPGGAGSG
jgi:selenocysteine-specific elongation factor